jgi:adenosylhomocysteinase
MVNHEVKDLKLAAEGKRRIEWADGDMPVLKKIRERFSKEKPLKGRKLSACLHVTAETANLMRTLQAGGAELMLVASNPLSTQDDVAAALVAEYGVSTYAIKGEDHKTYYNHIHTALKQDPAITMDDGADLVSTLHADYPAKCSQVICSMEETTTGVIRLRAMAKDKALHIPVIAVNDAETKYLFDNRYGTGQSTVDGIIRASDFLVAGKKIVIAGYGWCGKGFAMRMRGMGGNIIVTEVNPIRALEAAMDGFSVMPMAEAAKIGDLFCTLTGDIHVLRREHFAVMKTGAIVANSGHFNVEINIQDLEAMAVKKTKGVRNFIDEYEMKSGRKIYLLAEGRLINLAAAEGHPASVMDMSFATQALSTEYALKNKLEIGVYNVPREIEQWIAIAKLESMGVQIDQLTAEQKAYLVSWEMGT